MARFVISSTRRSAGKTGLIAGLSAALGGKAGYVKPLGDRLLYQKKRLWDYDAAVIARAWNLGVDLEHMTLGFEHAKLRFMYDAEAVKKRLRELADAMEKGRNHLFIESGEDLLFGASVGLDALSVARATEARLILVVGGSDERIADDIAFIDAYLKEPEVKLAGVVINKVQDPEEFRHTHLEKIRSRGLPILGILPFRQELATISAGFVAERLFARVLGGEAGLNSTVKNVLIGSIGSEAALREALKKDRMLIITSGDRSDVVLAALESDTACIVLTNDVMPPSHIVTKAAGKNVPVLLVPQDTFETARRIDALEPLLSAGDSAKFALLEKDVKSGIDLNALAK